MPANIITTDDLREFKTELIEQIKDIISTPQGPTNQKRFLKTSELQEALGLSPSTIHQLRIMRILPFTKINGVIFYDWEDIVVMMQKNKKIAKPKV
ncbi:MAG: helix-turn-helix domain-containing protein [Saprospiraceae bacterium]